MNWVRPTHIGEGGLLSSVHGVRCESQPEMPSQTPPESGVTPCLQPHSPVKLTYINHHTAFGGTGPSKEPAAPGVQDTSPTAARKRGQPQVTSNWQRRDGGLVGACCRQGMALGLEGREGPPYLHGAKPHRAEQISLIFKAEKERKSRRLSLKASV